MSAHVDQIARRCVRRARAVLGDGWAHVGPQIQWGLIASEVLAAIIGQHWIDDPEATDAQRAAVADYALALWRAASVLHENACSTERLR